MMWCPKCRGSELVAVGDGYFPCDFCAKGTITEDQLEVNTIPCPKCKTQGIVWKGNIVDCCDKCSSGYIKVTRWYWIRRGIEDYFLFYQPWRQIFLGLSRYLPKQMEERLVDRMYPDDMGIGFK